MRNDFYVGIYEDTYLSHTDVLGTARRYHKYLYRVWKDGKWRYYYSKVKRALNSDVGKAARKSLLTPRSKYSMFKDVMRMQRDIENSTGIKGVASVYDDAVEKTKKKSKDPMLFARRQRR